MGERGAGRPRLTFFPPPQSRQLGGPRPVDSDLDTNSHVPGSSSGRVGCHALLLMEKKVKYFEEAKKKTEHFHKNVRQQFLKEQERKVAQWKKARDGFEKSLEVLSRRSGKPPGPSTRAPSAGEAAPSEHAAGPSDTSRELLPPRAPAAAGPRGFAARPR